MVKVMFKKFYFIIAILSFFSCSTKKIPEKYIPPDPSNKSGKELAQIYCGSCHQLPNPELLTKNIWEKNILPKMAQRLGLEEDFFKLYYHYDTEELALIVNANIYPKKPQLDKKDWVKIVKYYVDNAPLKSIRQAKKEKVTLGLTHFSTHKIYGIKDNSPSVTAVKFIPENKSFYASWRSASSYLKKFSLNYMTTDSINVESPVSYISFQNGVMNYLSMGKMDPNNKSKGFLWKLTNQNKSEKIISNLSRPVQMSLGDLNEDGIGDFLICNFGNEIGNLTWYDGKTFKPNVIKLAPGARTAYIKDLNNDKKLDIVVLMTQAREGVYVMYNKGKAEFNEKQVLEFPPVYGSSFIDLVDFNKDGFLDIVYTNGDNADLSYSLKAYHGIRIFLNDRKGNFTQSYFFPMFGAAKAVAVDFDLDGDLDIAAISFFPNRNQKPNEGFLLLENEGNNKFKISTFKEASLGKWMVMDVADMDSDGDSDIILGSYLKNANEDLEEMKLKINDLPSIIVLENKIHN